MARLEAIIESIYDTVGFLRARGRFWLLPLFVVLILVGFFAFAASGSIAAPFIYALF